MPTAEAVWILCLRRNLGSSSRFVGRRPVILREFGDIYFAFWRSSTAIAWGQSEMAEEHVKLKSSDDEMFEVDEAVAFESQAVKNMIEDTGMDAPIPVPNVSSKNFAKVIALQKL